MRVPFAECPEALLRNMIEIEGESGEDKELWVPDSLFTSGARGKVSGTKAIVPNYPSSPTAFFLLPEPLPVPQFHDDFVGPEGRGNPT